jgi:hypothetical protein
MVMLHPVANLNHSGGSKQNGNHQKLQQLLAVILGERLVGVLAGRD